MHYNPVAQKYKIMLHTKYLTQEEFKEFFSTIKPLKQYTVKFLNPFSGSITTANCYRIISYQNKIGNYNYKHPNTILYSIISYKTKITSL